MESVTLDTELQALLSTSEASILRKAFGFETVGDLLRHYPRRYDPRGALTPIRGLPVGEHVTVIAEVVQVVERRMQRRSGSILEATITDGQGEMTLTWFNQHWRKDHLAPGQRGLFAGKVTEYRGKLQLAHPDFDLFDDDEAISTDPRHLEARVSHWQSDLVPIYPATTKVTSWSIRSAVKKVLSVLRQLDDPLPFDIRQRAQEIFDRSAPSRHRVFSETGSPLDQPEGILELVTALHTLHQPVTIEEQLRAKQSLLFREAFELQLGLLDLKRRAGTESTASWPSVAGGTRDSFDEAMPFTLTGQQTEVGEVLERELADTKPMHRLLQGEVGSGKTLVALRAMLQVADSQGQSALLAPTEVLASQHLRSITEMLGPRLTETLHPTLLTGQLSVAEQRLALLNIASGKARVIVGTHALMSERTTFENLGLIVIDEQHRFGVEQREALRRKGKRPPHVLVMTATPIPRTVALTTFGDLDVSTITEMPVGRAGIVSHVVPTADAPAWEQRAWDRAAEEIRKGRQVYVVCPAIARTLKEDSARFEAIVQGSYYDGDPEEVEVDFENVEDTLDELAQVPSLRGARISALTGAMPSDEKDRVMRAFAAGDIDLLVATTVIEVGVNVPNASMMIIRDAQRFGISQLHQLRGRVGRGEHEGLCLLVTPAPVGSPARVRVETVASTNDGFELADFDLQVRREGDLLGSRQSGSTSGLSLLRVAEHGEVIEVARELAENLLERDPLLEAVPLLADMVRRGRETDLQNLGKS